MDAANDFFEYVQACPTVPFQIDPSSHAYIVDEYVMDGLEMFFS